jgi:transcriptional regulator with XRE-family HTH domain
LTLAFISEKIDFTEGRMESLKSYLEMTGKSIEALAGEMGIAASTLYRAMKGDHDLKASTLLKLHELTGIKLDILVKESRIRKGRLSR